MQVRVNGKRVLEVERELDFKKDFRIALARALARALASTGPKKLKLNISNTSHSVLGMDFVDTPTLNAGYSLRGSQKRSRCRRSASQKLALDGFSANFWSSIVFRDNWKVFRTHKLVEQGS